MAKRLAAVVFLFCIGCSDSSIVDAMQQSDLAQGSKDNSGNSLMREMKDQERSLHLDKQSNSQKCMNIMSNASQLYRISGGYFMATISDKSYVTISDVEYNI